MLTKCILVVDDDKMNLMRTKKILEKTYAVLLAESGEVALTKLKTRKVDLVLLDIAMPSMSGILKSRKIRSKSRGEDNSVWAREKHAAIKGIFNNFSF